MTMREDRLRNSCSARSWTGIETDPGTSSDKHVQKERHDLLLTVRKEALKRNEMPKNSNSYRRTKRAARPAFTVGLLKPARRAHAPLPGTR